MSGLKRSREDVHDQSSGGAAALGGAGGSIRPDWVRLFLKPPPAGDAGQGKDKQADVAPALGGSTQGAVGKENGAQVLRPGVVTGLLPGSPRQPHSRRDTPPGRPGPAPPLRTLVLTNADLRTRGLRAAVRGFLRATGATGADQNDGL